jgi:hypothetical protein
VPHAPTPAPHAPLPRRAGWSARSGGLLAGGILRALLLLAAYRVYGGLLARLLRLDPDAPTPAVALRDDVDYEPIPPQLLLGQHFSAIAAAGPIMGPILAGVAFGWLPALLWILAGSIFIGGVHDFTALVASIRHGARSIAAEAEAGTELVVRAVRAPLDERASCPAGQFTGFTGSSCVNCAGGLYAGSAGSAICVSCPKGMYSASAAVSCVVCSAGTYMVTTSASIMCVGCAAGMFSASEGLSSCSTCVAGKYAAASAALACTSLDTCP